MKNQDFPVGKLPPLSDEPLTDVQIMRRVEHDMENNDFPTSSKAPLVAFAVALVSCLAVSFLAIGRLHPVEAARPAPRWINWTYSLEEGQSRAHKNQQKILIDFYTDWCPSCKWMDSSVYTQPEVLSASQDVVMVKINAEGREDLAKRYNIRVYPSFVWTDANGNETARREGSAPPSQFAALMAQNR